MTYDAEATRQRIFEAATAEFAANGLAGARIDRIATAARANKQAIYLYFGGKEKLFGAVVRAKLDEICHAVTLDPHTLPEAVGQLHDWYHEHPELVRLLLWEALEAGSGPVEGEDERARSYRGHVDGLLAAGLPDRPTAQDWLFTILGLVAWNFAVPQIRRLILDEPDPERAVARRREVVVELARVLAEQGAGAVSRP
ncbi:TetR family transcriptional regulator [Nonomuraea gerenzanensis]|uniref:Transcriptional regulator, TetR family n=1 Tax=Nonomuraea gerenzanensis TaxID=93944 RepID=A0A1M4ECD4_9ACTN|nr:TetR family transcriptional regulator [Nonomuraea gerenzanensis]UBU18709.1 TetR family transcriptional regulator [Nonomuraea gerenzanensis]SBO96569.1 Transcriptional regulator, TetR family [Nonomuraea gerenzanensis]